MPKLIHLFISITMVCFFTKTNAEQQSFTIGVQEIVDYRPYSEYQNNTYKGFNRELLDLFAHYGGYHFSYEVLPINRLTRYFLQGKIDLRYPDNDYWDTNLKENKSISYSKPVVRFIDGVLVKPEQKGKGIKELHKLGVVLGYTPRPYEKLIDTQKVFVFQNSNIKRLINQVKLGENSGLYVNIAVAQHLLKSLPGNNAGNKSSLVFDPDLPHIQSTRHLSTIKHPHIIEKFNQFLIDKAPQIEQLKSAYQVENIPDL